MSSALIALFVTTMVMVTQAEPPINVGLGDLGVNDGSYSSGLDGSYGAPGGGGDLSGYSLGDGASLGSSGGYGGDASGLGGYSDAGFSGYSSSSVGGSDKGGDIIATPAGKGVKYAGPIVYTNEKPPVIHFPPPPKPKKGGKGGYGKGSKAHSIKYVPLPHHELPILIYQSDINPPIHVVSPPQGATFDSPQAAYGPPQGDYGVPSAPVADYGVPQGKVVTSSVQSFEYGPPAPAYGPPKGSSAQYGPPKGEQHTPIKVSTGPLHFKQSYGPPKGDHGKGGSLKAAYGAPAKAAPLPHIIYTGHPPIHIFQQPPIYMSAPKASHSKASHGPPKGSIKAQYGPPKGDHHGHGHKGGSHHSKGEGHSLHSGLHSIHSSIHNSLKSHLSHAKSALSSLHSSLPSFKASIHAGHNSGGHSHSHSHKASSHSHKAKGGNYVVAPKGWNKPPIIIYQGVRPPVTVYEKPAGGYDSGAAYSSVSASAPVESYGAPQYSVAPLALAQSAPSSIVLDGPASLEHAHVAGTDAPGNPGAQTVDITYGIQRASPEAGQFIDPRHRGQQYATARSIWIPNYGSYQIQGQQPQPALYVSDLTAGGQQFQVLRRSDFLDQTIMSGVSVLRAESDKGPGLSSGEVASILAGQQQQGVQPQQMQARIDVLPTFLATSNDQSLGAVPASYNSMIVSAAGAQAGASALNTDPTSKESSSKSS